MDIGHGGEWLEHLVAVRSVSFATQKQALNALVFFYRDVCGMEDVRLDVKLRKTKQREPVVLTKEELLGLLDRLEGQYRLAAELQYGGGLRLGEVVMTSPVWRTSVSVSHGAAANSIAFSTAIKPLNPPQPPHPGCG